MDPDMFFISWDSPYIKIKEKNIKNHSMGCCGYHGNQWHNPFFAYISVAQMEELNSIVKLCHSVLRFSEINKLKSSPY